MPQSQPHPGSAVNENVPLLPVAHIMAPHLAGIAGQFHGLGRTRDVAPGPTVVPALGYGEGDLAGGAVPQLDPGLQDLPGYGGDALDIVLRFIIQLLCWEVLPWL